jgi:L-ascorbate metabolism protein UlaG (beta-lactamase superfamily)
VFGGVDLNRSMGGINSAAVEHMTRVSGGFGRVVWMPTFDAENQVRVSKENRPFVAVARNGDLLPEVKEVIALIAKHDLVLATGHSSPQETLMMLREAKRQGVRHMVVTHAMNTPVLMDVPQMQEAARLGAFIEFVGGSPASGDADARFSRFADAIRQVGPEQCILSSDLGQAGNPLPADGYGGFLVALRNRGISERDLDRMSRVNPARLFGLPLASDRISATGGDIEITVLIHSSLQIEHAGKVIQVDPWSAADLSRAKPADVILISDDPAHHLDAKAIARLRKPGAPVVMPASGKAQVADGIVLPNGQSTTAAGIRIESIAAYDLKPGAPEHPKGEANGYLVTLGGTRIYLAGVTECVPEAKALKNVDVLFIPMNIPPERMTPADAAVCTKALRPKVVYPYHYDQEYVSRLGNAAPQPAAIAGGLTVPQTIQAFRDAMAGEPTEVRIGRWYP